MEVCLRFGVTPQTGSLRVIDRLPLQLAPGTITLIRGPSGSGKSTLLDQIVECHATARRVDRVSPPVDRCLLECICPGESLGEALEILSVCGLAEPRLWLRRLNELSDGERFRGRFAYALGRQARQGGAPLLCDEFAAILHRRSAKAIAYNLRRLTTRKSLTLVLATSHDDLHGDLQPDVTVQLLGGARHKVIEHTVRNKPISFHRRLRIEPGTKSDYQPFAAMHYRQTDELGFVDKVFVMRDGVGGELLGIVVYSYGYIELSLRNQATDGRFKRNVRRLNRQLRVLRRLVIHPDVRGCGLGHWLVSKTLPLLNVPFVECLASMGQVNPVFERAGMRRIGEFPPSPAQQKALKELKILGVDPFDGRFAAEVCRRPRVRRIVCQFVRDWYRATTAGGEKRVAGQSPQLLAQTFSGLVGSRPVYYLWQQDKTP